MVFDFERFARIASAVYNDKNPYTLPQCLEVFRCYFRTYEEYIGGPHPPIRREQIARIMWDMPFLARPDAALMAYMKKTFDHDPIPDIDSDTYPDLINLHFKTRYRHCDYNINHFFSGKIRELRLYEADAGYQ